MGNGTDSARAAIDALGGHYRTGLASLGTAFFAPCLGACCSYRRAAGFFSSTALVTWSDALPRLARDALVELKLLASPVLQPADLPVIARASTAAERLRIQQELADRIVLDAFEFAQKTADVELRLRLLAWLIASGRLELRFAFPEHVEQAGIFHEKIGIFEFPWGAKVAFTGSANESGSGHTRNYESIDVYRDWVAGDQERVATKIAQFDEAWTGQAVGLHVLPLSPEAMKYVREHAPESMPLIPPRRPEPDPKPPRWRHQDAALAEFLAQERGILEMATGTGKTRTALRICEALVERGAVETIIVSTDGTDLLNQWQKHLVQVARRLHPRFSVVRHYESHHERDRFVLAPGATVLLCSRPELAPALSSLTNDVARKTLLIHDEVHRLGSAGNRAALSSLSDAIRYRLGLSATPEREYDADGTAFVEAHVGPVLETVRFGLADAIRRGVLCPFDYHPLDYRVDDHDRERLQQVFKRRAARAAAGKPMSDQEFHTDLARVHKTSLAKLPVFANFIHRNPQLLTRCIVFVETREYGDEVLKLVHRHRHDFHTYYASEDQETLRRFALGEIECLVTCHRLSEGIDIQNLRSVILFSSARARLETIQRIGRCLRSDPDDPHKRASVVDFVRAPEDDDEGPGPNADEERREWLRGLAAISPEGGRDEA